MGENEGERRISRSRRSEGVSLNLFHALETSLSTCSSISIVVEGGDM